MKGAAERTYQVKHLDHFEFSDNKRQNSGLPSSFSGLLKLATGDADQKADLAVSVRSSSSDLKGSEPDADWRPKKLSSDAEVTCYFRPGLELSTLSIVSSPSLLSSGMDLVHSSADLAVRDTTTISLKKGSLTFENPGYSRETHIDVGKGPVRGALKLYDLLSILTRSGPVELDIHPQPSSSKGDDSKTRQRAELKIDSGSGALRLNYPAKGADVPPREYITRIESESADVSGTFLHGKETKLAGNLNVKILPYGLDDDSKLTTVMNSGSSSIEVLPPHLTKGGNSLASMVSSHSVKAGDLKLKYPDEWEGSIEAKSQAGDLNVGGRDVKVSEQRTEGASKVLKAMKGSGRSQLKIDLGSGSFNATIGA